VRHGERFYMPRFPDYQTVYYQDPGADLQSPRERLEALPPLARREHRELSTGSKRIQIKDPA